MNMMLMQLWCQSISDYKYKRVLSNTFKTENCDNKLHAVPFIVDSYTISSTEYSSRTSRYSEAFVTELLEYLENMFFSR